MVPLDVCEVVMGSPYMWDRDVIFLRRANQWKLVKEGKTYLINAYKGKEKISLLSANQAKHLINSSQRLMMLVKRPREKKKQGVKNLSKLNLKPGYQQVRIKEEGTWKTVFKSKQGQLGWLVMGFDLANVPATLH